MSIYIVDDTFLHRDSTSIFLFSPSNNSVREVNLAVSSFHGKIYTESSVTYLKVMVELSLEPRSLAHSTALSVLPHTGCPVGLCHTVGKQQAADSQKYESLFFLVGCTFCTSPFQTLPNWILMLVTWLKRLCFIFPMSQFYSFSWYLVSPYPYFIHISTILFV